MRAHERRLAAMESQVIDQAGAAPLIVLYPAEWPKEERNAFALARANGDRTMIAAVIERQTGKRPAFVSGVVSFIVHHEPEGATPDAA